VSDARVPLLGWEACEQHTYAGPVLDGIEAALDRDKRP